MVPGLSPVCQFFGRPIAANVATHFFTANAQECASLRSYWDAIPDGQPKLKYEGISFYAIVPNALQQCPTQFPIPVIRYFFATPSPHHYYLIGDPQTGEVPAPGSAGRRDGVAFCTDVAVCTRPTTQRPWNDERCYQLLSGITIALGLNA